MSHKNPSKLSEEELAAKITEYEKNLGELPDIRRTRHTAEQEAKYRKLETTLERYRAALRERQGDPYPHMSDEDLISRIDSLRQTMVLCRPDEGVDDDDVRRYSNAQQERPKVKAAAEWRGLTYEQEREAKATGQSRRQDHAWAKLVAGNLEHQPGMLREGEIDRLFHDSRMRKLVRMYLPPGKKHRVDAYGTGDG